MKFFVLRNPKTGETTSVTDFLHADGSASGDAPRCSVCGGAVAMRILLPPIRVELETWSNEFGDIAFGVTNEILVTERIWHLYQASGLTGLSDVGPATIVKMKAHKKLRLAAPKYRCCRAAHSRTAIDQLKSGFEHDRSEVCSECRIGGIIKRWRRIVFEPDSWSGDDIFFARGLPGQILVSEKFKEFCDGNKVSNCLLIPAEEFSFDFYPWETKKKPVGPPSLN